MREYRICVGAVSRVDDLHRFIMIYVS